jgi:hypothetical protein
LSSAEKEVGPFSKDMIQAELAESNGKHELRLPNDASFHCVSRAVSRGKKCSAIVFDSGRGRMGKRIS